MARVKLGVVGCGAIAQVQHLPNLAGLTEEFEVTTVCDLSPGLADWAAETFHVPASVTDYRRLVASDDVEAVLLCHSDPKTEAAVAALDAGKHVLIEKPVCFTLREADAIVEAAERAGVVAQAGYMKVYDPAFETAKAEVDGMTDIRFVQVNHLHPDNRLHLRQFRLKRFDDMPTGPVAETNAARQAAVLEAIGEVSEDAVRAFFTLSGSMIHDLYCLRAMLGTPESVVGTEVWNEGRAISTVLSYGNGARCVASWVDLPDLWDFKETLEVYGGDRRVLVSYPTGFARGILSTVVVYEMDSGGETSARRPAVAWESPFMRELRHFHSCIAGREACRTPVTDAREDIRLIIDITRSFVECRPIPA
jgi:predicted dehydrogenase